MSSILIKVGDYVVATKDIGEVKGRSVGLVTEVFQTSITVFFIGANKTIETDNDHLAYLDIEKTGKPNDEKICNVCHLLKNKNEFEINQTDAKGRKTTRPSCKECRIAIDGKPLRLEEKRKFKRIRPKDVFTCPICQKTSIVDVTVKIVLDHDHNTGLGREWICDSCNTGLGRFKDDPVILQRAKDYFSKCS